MTLGFIKCFKYATLSAAQKFWTSRNEKGIFAPPHPLYNTEDNNMLESRKHLTHLADPSYYDIYNMHKEAREKFLQWYKIHEEEPFDIDRLYMYTNL